MDEEFWERKGVKLAFFLIALDVIALGLFLYSGFSWGFAETDWYVLCIVAVNLQQIIFPLANLPEPTRIFAFLTGIIPAGLLIACFVSMKEATAEEQQMMWMILFIALLLWDAVNVGWGIWAKKKSA